MERNDLPLIESVISASVGNLQKLKEWQKSYLKSVQAFVAGKSLVKLADKQVEILKQIHDDLLTEFAPKPDEEIRYITKVIKDRMSGRVMDDDWDSFLWYLRDKV